MSMRLIVVVALVLSAQATRSSAAPTVIYVSPMGDDAADGSAERPLATVHAAQRQVREKLPAGLEDVRVEIAPGVYFLSEPLVFTPADSGKSADRPVTYATGGEGVILSGGRKISGWRQEGDRWIADVKLGDDVRPFRDLWVNGRRAVRARTPNEGYFRAEQAGPDNRTSFTVAPADLVALAKPQAAEVAFLHDWSMSRIRFAGIEAATRAYRFNAPIGGNMPQFAISNFGPHPRYFVENAPELLDAPGEWHLDEETGRVQYMPREGESPDAAEVIAPRLEQLVVIRGEGEQPVQNVRFEGLAFAHSWFQIPPYGYAGIQSSWHERRTAPDDFAGVTMVAAVEADRARNISFKNCRFERLAACGLRLTRCQDSSVESCYFRDIGGDGALIGHHDASEESPTRRITVDDCLIEECGVRFYGAVGLWIGFASDTVVQHNELRNLPYTGVSVGWRWDDTPSPCRGHQIRQNRIHHIMQQLSDGGGIYTLGRQSGTWLSGNVIHDVPVNTGRAESNGIFMDEGSTEIRVDGNTIYSIARSPIRFHRAGPNTLVNNRLAAAPGVPTFTYNAADPSVMEFKDNQEISDASWQPPADDPAVKAAGPR